MHKYDGHQIALTRDQKRQLDECVCSVDNEPDQFFSVCGLPCKATYHMQEHIRAEIAAYEAEERHEQQ